MQVAGHQGGGIKKTLKAVPFWEVAYSSAKLLDCGTICVCSCWETCANKWLPILRCAFLQAFYNGFMPNFARLGSWNVAMFLMLEQVGGGGGALH